LPSHTISGNKTSVAELGDSSGIDTLTAFMDQGARMTDQALMSYFNFTEADVQANRMGQMSEAQKQSLLQEDRADRKWEFFGGGCMLVIGLIGLAAAITAVFIFTDAAARIGLGLMFGLIWPLIWGVLGVRTLIPAFARSRQIQLQKVQGPVSFSKVERTSVTTSDGVIHHHQHIIEVMQVGDKSFDVTEDLTNIMKQGDTYAVYYTEGADIYSIELISKAG